MDLEIFKEYDFRVLYSEESKLFSINRVYYNWDGKPETYGEEAAQVYGSDVSDLIRETGLLSVAFTKPVLYAGYRFPEEYKKH